MRTVFPSRELTHVWAHQLAPHGKATSRANESFYGDTYYSYAAPIGRIVKRRGVTAYLLAQKTWSKTTGSHQSGLRKAVPDDAIILYCHQIDDAPREMLAYCLREAATAATKAERARKPYSKDGWVRDQANWLDRARAVSKFYGLRNKIDNKVLDRLRAAQKRAEAVAAKLEAKKQAALKIKHATQLAEWLRGDSVSFPYSIDRCYLRNHHTVYNLIEYMQTSRGVVVPLSDAKRVFRLILRIRKSGVDWRRNGKNIPIGNYQLDAVNANGVVAGCHRLDWEEIERFAKRQGWME